METGNAGLNNNVEVRTDNTLNDVIRVKDGTNEILLQSDNCDGGVIDLLDYFDDQPYSLSVE